MRYLFLFISNFISFKNYDEIAYRPISEENIRGFAQKKGIFACCSIFDRSMALRQI
jgi:hypothetical protein